MVFSRRGPVLCVVMSSSGEQCYSGGADGLIQSWNTTNPNIDPYDSYGMWLPKIWRDEIFSFYVFCIAYIWIKWDVFENKFILLKRVSVFGNQFDIYIMLKKRGKIMYFSWEKSSHPQVLLIENAGLIDSCFLHL